HGAAPKAKDASLRIAETAAQAAVDADFSVVQMNSKSTKKLNILIVVEHMLSMMSVKSTAPAI
ncbi:unnamed protein product, partial [Amoebophrya sp. A25]